MDSERVLALESLAFAGWVTKFEEKVGDVQGCQDLRS